MPPLPKPAERRVRRNKDAAPVKVLPVQASAQPELPSLRSWQEITREWWSMWAASPLADDFTANDWSELMVAAVLFDRFWCGDTKVAPELRLRVAKFGATPEDRARLRVQFAVADKAATTDKPAKAARKRYEALRVAP